jgi:hypothetical protein
MELSPVFEVCRCDLDRVKSYCITAGVQHWEDLKKALADLEHNLFTKLEVCLPSDGLQSD